MIIKTPEELENLRQSGKILSAALQLAASHAKPGVSAAELDKLAEDYIRNAGAVPSFKNYAARPGEPKFPASLCVSVNDEVVHGIPAQGKILNDGDIVGLDLGVIYNGFYTDAAITVPVGKISREAYELIDTAKECLDNALAEVKAGKMTGDLGAVIEATAKQHKFQVVRDLVGHGVGQSVHEDPEIPCFGKPGSGTVLKEGLVIAVEPMVNAGSWKIYFDDDKWTIKTADGSLSAHMEHTVVVTADGCEILT